MSEFLSTNYLWIKAFHLIFVISWMAGLLYLPRLFVYHKQISFESPHYEMFLTMERRLLKIIMNPAGVLAVTFGLLLMLTPGVWQKGEIWLHVKIFLVIFLIIGHLLMVRWYNQFKTRTSHLSGKFFRLINEIPALLMIGIVILVILKPF